jgi:hypothetical protein
MSNRKTFSERFLEILDDGELTSCFLITDEAHFHLSGYVNKQNFRYWQKKIPANSTNDLCTVKTWLRGVLWRPLR